MTADPVAAARGAEADGLPVGRRVWAVVAVSASICITVLDSAMINLALPGIAQTLDISPAAATWLLNAYQLTVVSTLLPLASLGEAIGFRRVFLTGFGVFAVASIGAALAPTFETLLFFRVLMGLGAASVMSLTSGLIRHIYPAAILGRAIGINATVVAFSGAAAPTIAAAILSVAPWQALFAIHAPFSIAGIIIGLKALPAAGGRGGWRFDWTSAALNIATFALVFLGIDLVLHVPVVGALLLAAGLGAGVVLVRRQLSRPAPLLPIDLLRIRTIALSVAASVCAFSAWYGAYVSLPFLLQAAGRSPAETGLIMTPWPLGMAALAAIAGRLSDRLPTALICVAGMAMLATGLAVVSVATLAAHPVLIGAMLFLCGAGFGCFTTPNNRNMIGAAPKARSGGAGGMQATSRLLGTTLGTTVVALCFQVAGADGARLGLMTAIGFALVAAALSLSRRKIG